MSNLRDLPPGGVLYKDVKRRVLQALADHGALDKGLRVRTMVLPDVFLDHDTPAKMYEQAKLDADGIVTKVFEALGREADKGAVQLA